MLSGVRWLVGCTLCDVGAQGLVVLLQLSVGGVQALVEGVCQGLVLRLQLLHNFHRLRRALRRSRRLGLLPYRKAFRMAKSFEV